MKSMLLSLLFLTGCTTVPARADSTFKQCPDDPERQALRSQELRTLVKEDQDDRTESPSIGYVFFREMKPGEKESVKFLVRAALKLPRTTQPLPLFTSMGIHRIIFFRHSFAQRKPLNLETPHKNA